MHHIQSGTSYSFHPRIPFLGFYSLQIECWWHTALFEAENWEEDSYYRLILEYITVFQVWVGIIALK